MSNHIKKMLRITDENILVSNVIEKIFEVIIH